MRKGEGLWAGKNEDKKYFIKTWGCQMNVHDSEKIAECFRYLDTMRWIMKKKQT